MRFSLRTVPVVLVATLAAAAVQAQTTSSTTSDRTSYVPYTQNGYVGISGGQSKYDLQGGPAWLGQDNSDNAMKLYTGGYFNPNVGIEFGYLNAGKARRLNGDTEAHGFNLSLVGRAPLHEQFDIFGKIGTTYGRTKTSGLAGTGVRTGKEDGFGLSYGVGARWSFTPQLAAVVEWESHRFKFSDGNSDVKLTTVGLQYKF